MKKQLQLKELLVKIAEERCERLPGESDEDLLQRCGNWNFGKIAKLKYDQRVGRIRRPTVVKESNETIKCEKCGHSWNESEAGKEKYLCHICGHNNIPLDKSMLNEIVGGIDIDGIKSELDKKIKFIEVGYITEYPDVTILYIRHEYSKSNNYTLNKSNKLMSSYLNEINSELKKQGLKAFLSEYSISGGNSINIASVMVQPLGYKI